ncbi:MAG TPA: TRAP transporter permease [Burkholderiaceae bacterium]|nr:TRAP transporter permease [Burkholderiaceae bacterium]
MEKHIAPDPMPVKVDHDRSRIVIAVTAALAVALSLFQMYIAGIDPLGLFFQRGIHLTGVMMLAFLIFPPFKNKKRGTLAWLVDIAFLVAAFYSGFYLLYNLDDIFARAGFWDEMDIWMGILTIVVLLEACRRTVGLGMTVIGAVVLLYAFAGPRGALPWLNDWLPSILQHRGYDVERVAAQMYLGQEGIFGVPLGVAATFVFMFVLFGAVLEVTGAGRFFIDLAFTLTGKKRGGPAKAAVVASATLGSISGSAIANVVTSGAFTIPLMRKVGYSPEEAGGIEASASTGGQITPPLMGAGAFLIAEYTRLPYLEIVKVSIIPALLYFFTVYLFVHIIALKRNMQGMSTEDLPQLRATMLSGWYYLLPLGFLIALLAAGYSPMRVGFYAILSIFLITGLKGLWDAWHRGKQTGRMGESLRASAVKGLKTVWWGLELGARNAVVVSIACGVAGMIVAVVGLTGLGLKFTSIMMAFSQGNLLLAIILVWVASLIMGLGLPVTASYIVLVILVGPALANEFGVPLLIAHLLVFWYSQDSNVTPPVALAAFAAAAISGGKTMGTSYEAWKYAKGLYMIPMYFVFNHALIMGGDIPTLIWDIFLLTLSLVAFAAVFEGFLYTWMRWYTRLAVCVGMVLVFFPNTTYELLGVALIVVPSALNYLAAKRTPPHPVPAA